MNKTAVVAWGRANPPTEGHGKLFDKTIEHAKSVGGTPHIYVSHSQDTKKNPLSSSDKVALIKKAYQKHSNLSVRSSNKETPSIVHIASKLHGEGYDNLHLVAGSDRVEEYKNLLHKYNGKEGPHGYYNFKNISVISAGERDPDSEGTEGMSASKLRSHAIAGREEDFKRGLLKGISDKDRQNVYDKVRSSLKESVDNPYRFDDGDPAGTRYMFNMTPGLNKNNIICPEGEEWSEEKGVCVPRTNETKIKFRKENTIPFLLMTDKQKKALSESNNQLTFDGYSTTNFDLCPTAHKVFSKNIQEFLKGPIIKSEPMVGVGLTPSQLDAKVVLNPTLHKRMTFKNYVDQD